MPYKETLLDLSAAFEQSIVPDGNRINAISITELTAGSRFSLKVGNNGLMTIPDQGVVRIGNTALVSDAQQGVRAINTTPQAGAIARVVVSYTRKTDKNSEAPSITFEVG
jgi:hypothetical protein